MIKGINPFAADIFDKILNFSQRLSHNCSSSRVIMILAYRNGVLETIRILPDTVNPIPFGGENLGNQNLMTVLGEILH
jgi:hypothetical protein